MGSRNGAARCNSLGAAPPPSLRKNIRRGRKRSQSGGQKRAHFLSQFPTQPRPPPYAQSHPRSAPDGSRSLLGAPGTPPAALGALGSPRPLCPVILYRLGMFWVRISLIVCEFSNPGIYFRIQEFINRIQGAHFRAREPLVDLRSSFFMPKNSYS